MRTGSQVLSTGAAVPAVGTCEGYEFNFQHNAPHKVVSSQDGGRLGERARARAQHSCSELLKVGVQSHASAMLTAQRSRCRHVVEGHPLKISRTAAAIATN
jgi:hypothetical protein